MQRLNDKYGRGSAAVNGAEFVDLEPGDTFSGLEAKLRLVQTVIYENRMLGLRASIASRRNANELSKRMAPGEEEEAHKFAAKNVGALFARGVVGVRHFDKKAVTGARWIVTYVRVFSWFVFAGKRKLATITLKENKDLNNFYSVEAVEINEDADSERTPRGAMSKDLNSAPFQNLTSQLADRIAYYVGDVNSVALPTERFTWMMTRRRFSWNLSGIQYVRFWPSGGMDERDGKEGYFRP